MPQKLDASLIKEKILTFIKNNGPSLPIQVAKAASIEPLFASAFLSELYREGKILMSHMKIGSSSLYLLREQEAMLESFFEHLNPREKEAFLILKNEKVLKDSSLTPVIRVALRAIPDFAIKFVFNEEGKEEIFWRYFLISEEDAKKILSEKININQKKEVSPILGEIEKKENIVIEKEADNVIKLEETTIKDKHERIKKIRKSKEKLIEETDLSKKIKDYAIKRNIQIKDFAFLSKKEIKAKILVDTPLGQQEYVLVAKDKKKISDADIALAFQLAQTEKTPLILISPGKLDKKAEEQLSIFKNILKFERI